MEAGFQDLSRLLPKSAKQNKTANKRQDAATASNDPELATPAAANAGVADFSQVSQVFRKIVKTPIAKAKLEAPTGSSASAMPPVDVLDTLTTPRCDTRRLLLTPRRRALPFRTEWKPKITPRVEPLLVEPPEAAAAVQTAAPGGEQEEDPAQAGAKCSPIAEGREGSGSVAEGSVAQDSPTNQQQAQSPLGRAWDGPLGQAWNSGLNLLTRGL